MAGEGDTAVRAVAAVQRGDADALRDVLAEQPDLATYHLDGRTLLHVFTDWPGHRPNAAEMVAALVAAGADVNAPFVGEHAETPLHWAASNDDVECVDALLDAGAAIDASGGSVGDGSGTPLFDATVFGQWAAGRRLVERGAATGGWEEASLGLTDRLTDRLAQASEPSNVTAWFWAACHGGQQACAELLLDAGADRDWVSTWDGSTALDAALRAESEGTAGAGEVVSWLRGKGAPRRS
jgi:ankyrin repeat protein